MRHEHEPKDGFNMLRRYEPPTDTCGNCALLRRELAEARELLEAAQAAAEEAQNIAAQIWRRLEEGSGWEGYRYLQKHRPGGPLEKHRPGGPKVGPWAR
jgi:hypothetical protein